MNDNAYPYDPVDQSDIPAGLRMALAQNAYAAQYFENLPPAEQLKVVDTAARAASREEMDGIVSGLIRH